MLNLEEFFTLLLLVLIFISFLMGGNSFFTRMMKLKPFGNGSDSSELSSLTPLWKKWINIQLVLAKCEATANEAASLIFSFHEHATKEEMASEMSCLLSKFADNFKAEIQDTCLQVLFSDCREKSTVGIFFLLDDIKGKAKSIVFLKHHGEILLGDFEFLKSFLMDTAEHCIKHQEVTDLWTCINDVACETDYITDLLVVRNNALCYFMLWLPSAMEDIKFIRTKVKEIYDEKRYGIGANGDATAGRQRIDDVLVGLDRNVRCIIEQLLITETKRTEIIPIVARVDWVYQMRELFLQILRDVMVVSNRIYDMDDDALAGVLYKCLRQKRYLIVLDDIWDSAAVDALRISFPDDNLGSRIMLTSRKQILAVQDSRAQIFYHSRLSDNECWRLLCRKTLGDTPLPDELKSKLLRYCNGVPLAVSIMAGVLEKIKTNLSHWVKLEDTLSSYLDHHTNELSSVLKIAYDTLPDHLKPCFLYFGEFPEDKEIPARKLFRLWITNGLIQETESTTSEEVAEEYLLDIISRNLVTISGRTHNGRVRGCRVHDVVLRFCWSMNPRNCTSIDDDAVWYY